MRSIRTKHSVTLALIIVMQSMQAMQGSAETADEAAVKSDTGDVAAQEKALEIKRRQISDRLRSAEKALEAARAAAPEDTSPPAHLVRVVERLKEMDLILAQQESAERRIAESEATRARLQESDQILTTNGPSEPRPYSFLRLDRLRDELEAETARGLSVRDAVAVVSDALSRAKESQQEKDRARRLAKERVATNRDEKSATQLEIALAAAELESQVAAEEHRQREIELKAEQLGVENYELGVALLKKKIDWVAGDTKFTKNDLQTHLLDLQKKEFDLKQSLEEARINAPFLERQWMDARQQLDRFQMRGLAKEQGGTSEGSPMRQVLAEQVEARRLARQANQQEITSLNQRVGRIAIHRILWDRRYRLATVGASSEEMDQWQAAIEGDIEQLSSDHRLLITRTNELRAKLQALNEQLEATNQIPVEISRWLRDRRTTLQKMIQIQETDLLSIEASRRLHGKLLSELRGDDAFTLSQWLALGWRHLVRIWNYEITTTVDERPITVSKIVIGLFLLIQGFLVSRYLSRSFGSRLLLRLGVDEGAAAALQSVLFYSLVVVFSLFALRMANVPLTSFTILGGAAALGLGFGSQSVINNFVSGLILLAERPLSVGDTIELNGLHGIVEHIGARSTRLKTQDNLEIIMPNSSFLQNNVINWTLSDHTVRTCVKVGVAYGSAVRDVTRMLARAAQEHGKILKKPEPLVLFADFADSSLNFELHFWIIMRTITERQRIESDLRCKIDHLFREAGIVIAFPQQDMHLDAAQPIEVRLVSSADSVDLPATNRPREAA